MTLAPTTISICATQDNLSAAMNHYDTYNDLCSTIMDTILACNNLSAAANQRNI